LYTPKKRRLFSIWYEGSGRHGHSFLEVLLKDFLQKRLGPALGGLFALLVVLAPWDAEADPCAPAAVVSGDPATAAAVRQLLAARGIATAVADGCPAVRAEVAPAGGAILTAITDEYGRSSARVVDGPEVAAVLIESWARSDLSADLLDAPTVAAATALAPTASSVVVTEEDALAGDWPAPTPGAGGWTGWLGLVGETTIGLDRSSGFGTRLGACGRVGPACLGGLVRFGYDPGLSGSSELLQTRRVALDGLLLVDFPLEWPRVTLAPGLGLGGGWSRSSRTFTGSDDAVGGGEQVGDNQDEGEVEGRVEEDSGGLRVDAHVALAIALTAGLSLDVTLSIGLSALGKYGVYYYEDDTHMAAEPRAGARAGLGLSYRFR
jgi:hypothetical protein